MMSAVEEFWNDIDQVLEPLVSNGAVKLPSLRGSILMR